MTKKRILLICAVCAMIITLGCLGVAAAVSGSFVEGDAADLWALEQDALKDVQLANDAPVVAEGDLYTKCYSIASDEQKKLLDNIEKDSSLGAVGTYTKQIKIIMNDLPETMPYLTKEQAISLCSTLNLADYISTDEFEYAVAQLFNQVAGAPDFEGGSGIHRAIYYTDDTHAQYIVIRLGKVEYVDNQENTTETILSILQ